MKVIDSKGQQLKPSDKVLVTLESDPNKTMADRIQDISFKDGVATVVFTFGADRVVTSDTTGEAILSRVERAEDQHWYSSNS